MKFTDYLKEKFPLIFAYGSVTLLIIVILLAYDIYYTAIIMIIFLLLILGIVLSYFHILSA